MATGNITIFPDSNTFTGNDILEEAFNSLIKNGINTNLNMNGNKVINSANPSDP